MDFELTDEQRMLQDTVRDLLARGYDPERRNTVIDTDPGFDPAIWRTLAEVGVLGLTFAEDDGGMGAGPVEAMLIATEIGRRLAPEPVLTAALIPGGLVAEAGTELQRKEILPKVAEGALRLAFAHTEPGHRFPAPASATTAVRQGDSWVVTGRKHPVEGGDGADLLIVSAATESGAGLFLIDPKAAGVTRRPYRAHDGSRGADIEFASVVAEPLGSAGDAAALIDSTTVRAQALLCAEAVGAMEEALRLTTEYLKTRKQFGVALRTFQTLTQRAADMYVSLELARSMSYYVTMSLADGVPDPTIAARAKLRIGRSGRHIGQEAVQLHGGIGMTAEYPVGHYLARLTAINHTLGDTTDNLRTLAAHVGDHQLAEL
ncbi:acyl-CoA dehydrogenase family protein [Nocardia alni]|uniref:acyl-CoA dehydrogenase family protein n=1 Tax=Nocardia alni TaxID=2815723 RepID=UPI001C21989A|nr:acyl-CoA dehydrogenase family protein [Nocardia alni]